MDPCCRNCRHSIADAVLACHRFPPQMVIVNNVPVVGFPGVAPEAWCAEWDTCEPPDDDEPRPQPDPERPVSLSRALQIAVAAEDYEHAAKIRDRMRGLCPQNRHDPRLPNPEP